MSSQGIRAGRAFVEFGADDSPLSKAMDRMLGRFRSFGAQLAAAGAGLVGLSFTPIGGLLTLTKLAASAGSQLNNLAIRTGLAVTEIKSLQTFAELSGASLDDIVIAFQAMNVGISKLRGGSEEAAKSFGRLGLSVGSFASQTTYEQFLRIADVISRLPAPTEQARAAAEIFGKAGAKLLPLLVRGSAGLEAARRRFEALGITIGSQAAASIAEFDDLFAEIVAQLGAVKNVIGAAAGEFFLPIARAIQPILAYTIRWVDKNKQLVGTILAVSAGGVALGSALAILGGSITLASVGLSGLASGIGLLLSPFRLASVAAFGLASSLIRVATGLGGLVATSAVTLAGAFVAAGAGALRLVGLIPQLLLIGPAVSGAVGAVRLLGITFAAVGSAIIGILPGVIGAVAGFAGTLASTVIGAFVGIYTPLLGFIASIEIAISTALIGAVSAVAPAVGTLLLAITSQFGLLLPAIAVIGAAVGPLLILKMLGGTEGIKSALGDFFGDIGTSIGSALGSAIGFIGDAFSNLAIVIRGTFNAIPGLISRTFDGLRSVGEQAVSGLITLLGNVRDLGTIAFTELANVGSRAWAFISDRARGLGTTIGDVYKGAVGAFQSGRLELAGEIATTGIQLAWEQLKAAVSTAWASTVKYVLEKGTILYSGVLRGWEFLTSGVTQLLLDLSSFAQETWIKIASGARVAFEGSIDFTTRALITAQEKVGAISKENADAQRRAADQITQQRRKEIEEDLARALGSVDTGRQAQQDLINKQTQSRVDEINKLQRELLEQIDKRGTDTGDAVAKRIESLKKRLADLNREADKAQSDQQGNSTPAATFDVEGLTDIFKKLKSTLAFGADINVALSGRDTKGAENQIAQATKETAKNTATMVTMLEAATTVT